jgi:hypothetical protein
MLMLRALGLTMAVLLLPHGYASADAPPDLAANAALKYWQAFATLPKFSNEEGQKLNAECLTMTLDAHAREVVTKAEYALLMTRHGAALPRCEWAVGFEEGIYARLPHAPAAREISSLLCLRARLRFEEGRNAEAIDDILTGMTLGRHISQNGTLIVLYVGYAIEHRLSEALALNLPKLDAAMAKGLKTRLDALPPGGSSAQALRLEEKFGLDWFVRTVKETKDTESLLTILGPLFHTEGVARLSPEERANGRAFLEACGGTTAGMLKMAEEVRPSYELMAKKLGLPPDEFDKEFARETKKQASNPVFKLIFAAIHRGRHQQARVDVRRALLSAAVAVQIDGRDALKDHPDPVVGGPFDYTAFDGGFELGSKWKPEDKPLALTVGRRGK